MKQSFPTGFAHQRLDAYAVAQDLACGVARLSHTFPRGFAEIRDQLQRASLAVARHIAEGASRATPADKRARFVVARGECAECDASLDTALRLGLAPEAEIHRLRALADRLGAMLTGLVLREGSRVP
jgi:four helix bundle protein